MELFFLVVEIAATGFENYIILSCCNKLMPCKHKDLKKSIIFLIFLCISTTYVTMLNQFMAFEGALSLITIFIFVLYGMLGLEGSLGKKIFVPISLFSLILCINVFVMITFTSILNVTVEEISSEKNLTRLITLFITKFMFYIASEIMMHFFRKESFRLKKSELILNIILIILTYSIGLNAIEAQIHSNRQNMFGIISIFCIIINICIFYILRRLAEENKKEAQIKLLKLQLSEQKTMIEEAANIGMEIRAVNHNVKHHFLSVLGLLENNDCKEAKNYIEKALGQHEDFFQQFLTLDSSAINGILNFKISRCRSKHIDTKVIIESDFNAFDELDICVLLSNLFDNAIEASGCIDNPKIELSITSNGNYLCFFIRNKINHSILKNNKLLETSKPDKTNHGFGIYSISEIVEKYDGMKDIYKKMVILLLILRLRKKVIAYRNALRRRQFTKLDKINTKLDILIDRG